MQSDTNGNVARSEGLQRLINRRRFLGLCGGAAVTLAFAACADPDATPAVEQVILDEGQIPAPGSEPLHSDEGRFYLVNNGDELMALYSRCTHQGCTVEWKADDRQFACPCHGSKFDRNGVRTDGPAERPLDLMRIHRQPDGSLIIDTGAITRRQA